MVSDLLAKQVGSDPRRLIDGVGPAKMNRWGQTRVEGFHQRLGGHASKRKKAKHFAAEAQNVLLFYICKSILFIFATQTKKISEN